MNKFKSRKFLLALLGIAIAVASLFRESGGTVGVICSLICIFGVVVTYILTEGANDKQGIIAKVAEALKQAGDVVIKDDKTNELLDSVVDAVGDSLKESVEKEEDNSDEK